MFFIFLFFRFLNFKKLVRDILKIEGAKLKRYRIVEVSKSRKSLATLLLYLLDIYCCMIE
ncbi:hypothetical protein AB674_19820 [Flavobacterium sp. ABG]|nr:hypothetical protein AB674_19820 [Flavobacterium sp. ABG]